jgi:tetratricopeptide (TPR) repeat protein
MMRRLPEVFARLHYGWLVFRDWLSGVPHWLPFWISPVFWLTVLLHPFRLFLATFQPGRWRQFLLGMPAVVCTIAIASLHQWTWTRSEDTISRYMDAARSSSVSGDFARAQLMLDRVLLETRDQPAANAMLNVAELLQETGQSERAIFLLTSLAPDDSIGHPAAHRQLAMILCEQLSLNTAAEELRRVRHHLESAGDRVSPEMLLAWGRYYVGVRDLPAAQRMFEQITSIHPEVEKPLGTIYLELGYREKAMGSFTRAREFLRKRVERDHRDRSAREDYAAVLIHLGEMEAARSVIEEGKVIDPEGPWTSLLGSLHVILHDIMVVSEQGDTAGRLTELGRALEYDPDCLPALERLAGYIREEPAQNHELKSLLFRIVADAGNPALAHLMLGNVYWLESNSQAAVFHFERCVELNPKLAVVLNNLAWALAHQQPSPQLDRALTMIESALEEAPGVPRLLDTRGTILMKMGRWREALEDLERALAVDPAIPGLHLRLAEVYLALDHPEIAAEHRRLALEWQPEGRLE